MDSFFDSNPGFKSRVPFTFRFEESEDSGRVGVGLFNKLCLTPCFAVHGFVVEGKQGRIYEGEPTRGV